ncbi:hypothetical protein K469DRAFT_755086 [Zopfia rhizophila CBS 207.26]|uniref:Uncharacterized protein n=1 Tax=Zopfia rhizophila CBS 207.26 TaxID=1314779 RepID=A0A6A6DGJ5_9PEZI|nr:hypothetical protein K469DRAFT_755086 [Zopfia rhizophila CBS 207.26]
MQFERPQTPPPQPPLKAVISPPTPCKAWQLNEFARKHIYGVDPETGQWGILPGRFSKFQKGAVAAALNGEKAGEELIQVNVATNARKKRQKGNQRHIQKGGTIYVYDARLRVAEREKEDARKKGSAVAKGKSTT